MMQGTNPKRATFYLLSVLVALAAFLVYLPSLSNGFVNWDDDRYVYANPALGPLGPGFILASLSSVVVSNWHPLTMVSYSLDYTLWGLNPFGFHLTNTILHALNTALVFILTLRLINVSVNANVSVLVSTSRQPHPPKHTPEHTPEHTTGEGAVITPVVISAAVTALLFAVHPLHVESVVWVSERKDVLSAFFFLLAIGSYLSYAERAPGERSFPYALVITFSALSLMSKSMAVTLPLVLLVLDFYPLRRFTISGGRGGEGGEGGQWAAGALLIVEKLPLFALSLFTGLIALWTQADSSALITFEANGPLERVLVASRAYVFYIYKTLLPLELSPFYPFPPEGGGRFGLECIGGVLGVLAIGLLAFFSLKRSRLFFALWLYYSITLVPVIGLVQVGSQVAADRYTYLPGIALFLLLGLGAGEVFKRSVKKGPGTVTAMALALALALASLTNITIAQGKVWKDPLTLWNYVLRLYPESAYVAYNNRGMLHYLEGSYSEAYADFNKASSIDPAYAEPLYNIGVYHFERKELNEAEGYFMRAIETDPGYTMAYLNLGVIYTVKGEQMRAIEMYDKTLELTPMLGGGYYNRGNSYYALGEFALAAKDYTRAIEQEPLNADTFNKRGAAYFKLGEYKRAIDDHTRAIELQGRFLSAYLNRANALVKEGNPDAATSDYRTVIRLDPRHGRAYYNLAQIYLDSGDNEKARSFFNMAAGLGYQGALDEDSQ